MISKLLAFFIAVSCCISALANEIMISGGSVQGNGFSAADGSNIELDSGSTLGLSYSWPYTDETTSGQGRILYSRSVRDISSNWDTNYDNQVATDYLHFSGVAFYQDGNRITTFDIGIGVAQISPEDDRYSSTTAASLTTAIAARYHFSKTLGVQLEGRVYASLVDSSDDLFCDNDVCQGTFEDDFWIDSQVTLGLFWHF